MVDLFKYASDHDVSIEISPVSKFPKQFYIRMRRGHHQFSSHILGNSEDRTDEKIEFALGYTLHKLEEGIKYFKKEEMVYDNSIRYN